MTNGLSLFLMCQVSLLVVGGLLAFTFYEEFSTRHRMWHVANLRKLAESKFYCRILAKTLEIPDDAGDPAEYVQFALNEAADYEESPRKKSHD